MKVLPLVLLLLFIICVAIGYHLAAQEEVSPESTVQAPSIFQTQGYVGSAHCRECHERFYELWSGSHHGRALQPYSVEFAQKYLTPQTEGIKDL